MTRRSPGSELHRLVLFACAGGLGFLVDTAVLYAVKGVLGLYFGRVLSFLAAVFTTWLINRLRTFGDRHSGHGLVEEFLRYTVLMLAGGAANIGAYAVAVALSPLVARYPVLGVALGSGCGMVVNYFSMRWLMFRHRHPGGPD